jgi:hypothetical protein
MNFKKIICRLSKGSQMYDCTIYWSNALKVIKFDFKRSLVELSMEPGKEGKEKRMIGASVNIIEHNICEGRGYKDM